MQTITGQGEGSVRQGSKSQGRRSIYGDFPFEFRESTQIEEEQLDRIRELEGLDEEEMEHIIEGHGDPYYDCSAFSDVEHEAAYPSTEDESFHSDDSNKDHSDDDLIFDINVDHEVEDLQEEVDEGNDDSSVYAASDDEKMPCNSTDDEEEEIPVFNEEVDMERPVFELGMCVKSSKIFRQAVKKKAILERRPIKNCKNFGRKIKYQKQINSSWIAEYYESDIRMNPTWPISAFHRKIVNELKCEVSRHAVYRAKTKALIKIRGTHEDQFQLVWKYAHQLQKTLPGSTIKVLTEDPEPEHRFCVMHLYQNMHKDYQGIALRQLLWKCARASTDWEFKKHMNKLKEVSVNYYDWLMAKPKEQWSRCGFRTNTCSDMFVNNHCEVFNKSIRQFRDLPIVTMFREIHKAVMNTGQEG
ncbi:hypothetical protein DCAR_0623680 [Daucus carota subsp. sativus]|uniref:Transposase MuDR plant domain-containing protein n=1 Tax=Daucus carota subsp. sativus TaxID=79200 RepID=A0AAF0X9P0_DAUCS|nr:hypothetical protein DCAR_0623680 [Daucus carota subsp. sativus]